MPLRLNVSAASGQLKPKGLDRGAGRLLPTSRPGTLGAVIYRGNHAENTGLFCRQNHHHHRRREWYRPRHRADFRAGTRQREGVRGYQRDGRARNGRRGRRQRHPGAALEGRCHRARRSRHAWFNARSILSAACISCSTPLAPRSAAPNSSRSTTRCLRKPLRSTSTARSTACRPCCRTCSRNQHGVIINMASMAHRRGGPGSSIHYAAAKGAVVSMTLGVAREFAGQGHPRAVDLARTDKNAVPGRRAVLARIDPAFPRGRADEAFRRARRNRRTGPVHVLGRLPVHDGRHGLCERRRQRMAVTADVTPRRAGRIPHHQKRRRRRRSPCRRSVSGASRSPKNAHAISAVNGGAEVEQAHHAGRRRAARMPRK